MPKIIAAPIPVMNRAVVRIIELVISEARSAKDEVNINSRSKNLSPRRCLPLSQRAKRNIEAARKKAVDIQLISAALIENFLPVAGMATIQR